MSIHLTLTQAEGFLSTTIAVGESKNFNVPTPDIYTALGGDVAVKTMLVGKSNLVQPFDHEVEISINGTVDTSGNLYDGYNYVRLNLQVPLTDLTNGTTPVTVRSLPGLAVNTNLVAYISVQYPHTYSFSNANNFQFEIGDTTDHYLEITNFNGGTEPVLYDLTNHIRLQPIVEGSVYKFLLKAVSGGATMKQLFLSGTNFTASQLHSVAFVDYSQVANQGNYIILTHPTLRTGAVDYVQAYDDYRSSPAGGNYQTAAVDINVLYDQYAYGIMQHPQSIRNFVKMAVGTWAVKPELLLLLGKGVEYRATNISSIFNANLVPTFGSVNPSDLMLVSQDLFNYSPLLSVGRVAAKTGDEVRLYLEKLQAYEGNNDDGICSREEKTWMKHALHVAGGNNLDESGDFLTYLNGYKAVFEDTLLGGKVVHTYNKQTNEVIDVNGELLIPYVNAGVGVINFFGHSGGELLNVRVFNDPLNFDNEGKYPFFITGSCSVGNIFNYAKDTLNNFMPSLAEKYMLTEDRGAIGMLGAATSGVPSLLDRYLDGLYAHFCRLDYNQPIGTSLEKTVAELYVQYPYNPIDENSKLMRYNCQSYTLSGDPAVVVSAWPTPDYIIEETDTHSDVTFLPTVLTTDLTSFQIVLTVSNLGKAVGNSFTIRIARTLPNGTVINYDFRRPSTIYADTLTFDIPIGDVTTVVGENVFTITVDADNEIAEQSCEQNNSVTLTRLVFGDLPQPIAPCNFAIVAAVRPTLYASTNQPLAPLFNYEWQIDTTELFNSAVLSTHHNVLKRWRIKLANTVRLHAQPSVLLAHCPHSRPANG